MTERPCRNLTAALPADSLRQYAMSRWLPEEIESVVAFSVSRHAVSQHPVASTVADESFTTRTRTEIDGLASIPNAPPEART
jgi:hypothetical protein